MHSIIHAYVYKSIVWSISAVAAVLFMYETFYEPGSRINLGPIISLQMAIKKKRELFNCNDWIAQNGESINTSNWESFVC